MPTICRVVVYRSRTGRYDVPAIVTATLDTLDPQGVELCEATNGEKGVPALSSPSHVHLTVLTPGIPGFRAEGLSGAGDTPLAERDHSERAPGPRGYGENAGGTYQEWDVPFDSNELPGNAGSPQPGTWRWPARV